MVGREEREETSSTGRRKREVILSEVKVEEGRMRVGGPEEDIRGRRGGASPGERRGEGDGNKKRGRAKERSRPKWLEGREWDSNLVF